MRRARSPYCARATSGHAAAAAPPRSVMNSRRRRQMLIWPSLASQWIKPEGAGQRRPATGGRPTSAHRRPDAGSTEP
jgi:hypothetical protein